MSSAWALIGYVPQVTVTAKLRPGILTSGVKGWFLSDDPIYQVPVTSKLRFRAAGDKQDTMISWNDCVEIRFSP